MNVSKVVQDKCKKAGISFWLASEVALELEDEIGPELTEEETNNRIISKLREKNEEEGRKFENYHNIYVRTSKGLIESFDKEKILESMLKETTLSKTVCEEISNEVESDVRRLGLRKISAPAIREMVNFKLLERKYKKAKDDYARIGLPIYDVKQAIKQPPNPEAVHKKFGDAVSKEYTLIQLLPEETSNAHLTGLIHIHDLAYFPTRPTSLQNDFRWFLQKGVATEGAGKHNAVTGPAKHLDVAVSHAVRILISGETHLSGGQSFDFFNLFLAPYTINSSDKELEQAVQTFIYELNQIYAVKGGQIPNTSLNFDLEAPEFLKKEKAILPGNKVSQDTYQDYEKEAIRILNTFLRVMSKGDFEGNEFAVPKICLKVKEGAIPLHTEERIKEFLETSPLHIINLRNDKMKDNTNMVAPSQLIPSRKRRWFQTLRTGVLQEVSINLPRIAFESREDTEFFSKLDKSLEMSEKACKKKQEIIRKRLQKNKSLPFLTQEYKGEEYYSLENSHSTINLVGMDNAIQEYKGRDLTEKEGKEFAEKILNYTTKKLDNFNKEKNTRLLLGNVKAEKASKRFSKLNQKRFGVKEVFPRKGFSHKKTTGWVDNEIKLQKYCFGGSKLEITPGEDPVETIYQTIDKKPLCFKVQKKSK